MEDSVEDGTEGGYTAYPAGHPGAYQDYCRRLLRQALALAGISQAALARETGLTTKHINQVFQGKAPVSAEVAVRMEGVLPGIDAEDLMVTQTRAQVHAARMARFNQGTEQDPTRL